MMKINRKARIWIAIIFFHLCFALIPYTSQKTKPLPKKNITVRNITPVYHETTKQKAVKIKQKPIPVTKKSEPIKKKVKTNNNPQKKSTTPSHSVRSKKAKELLRKLDKQLDSFEKSPSTKLPNMTPPPIVLQSTQEIEDEKIDCTSVINFLHDYLQLPEKDEIKVTITVQPNGMIDNMRIIYCKSKKNRDYMSKTLVNTQLPRLSDKPINLTIIFRGEEI